MQQVHALSLKKTELRLKPRINVRDVDDLNLVTEGLMLADRMVLSYLMNGGNEKKILGKFSKGTQKGLISKSGYRQHLDPTHRNKLDFSPIEIQKIHMNSPIEIVVAGTILSLNIAIFLLNTDYNLVLKNFDNISELLYSLDVKLTRYSQIQIQHLKDDFEFIQSEFKGQISKFFSQRRKSDNKHYRNQNRK